MTAEGERVKCKCTIHQCLVGDGCEVCNPTYAHDMAKLTIADLESERDRMKRALEVAVRCVKHHKEIAEAGDYHFSKAHDTLAEISKIMGEE